jgi:Bacterial Ig-like domain (group 2)/WD40-like Beta Propeller Repeat
MRCPLSLVATALVSAAGLACETPNATPVSPELDAAAAPVAPDVGPKYEEFTICKYGSGGDFAYTIANRNTDAVTTGSIELAKGTCKVIAVVDQLGAEVTVREKLDFLPAGYRLDKVVVTRLARVEGQPQATTTVEAGPAVTGIIAGGASRQARGVLAAFYNVKGGQGCGPDFWGGHRDLWPAPYRPNQLFSAYFVNAFPGKTLYQVLTTPGTGMKAFGRQAVAALLNAASGLVAYDLTVTQVKATFRDGYRSENYAGDYQRLLKFNTQACPLLPAAAPGVERVIVSPTASALLLADALTATATVEATGDVSREVTWTSEDPSIASVDARGRIVGVGLGATTIRATSVADPTRTGTASVTVTVTGKVLYVSGGDLFVSRADGTGAIQLNNDEAAQIGRGGWPGTPARLSHDGNRVAFVSDYSVYTVNADGTDEALADPHYAGQFCCVAWSWTSPWPLYTDDRDYQLKPPDFDSDRDEFMGDVDRNGRILSMSAPGPRFGPMDVYVDGRNVTMDPGDDVEARWSDDGTRVVFTSSRSGNGDIYLLDPATGVLRRLTESAGSESSPVFAMGDRKILFLRGGEIWIMNVDGSNQLRVRHLPTGIRMVDWGP